MYTYPYTYKRIMYVRIYALSSVAKNLIIWYLTFLFAIRIFAPTGFTTYNQICFFVWLCKKRKEKKNVEYIYMILKQKHFRQDSHDHCQVEVKNDTSQHCSFIVSIFCNMFTLNWNVWDNTKYTLDSNLQFV